MIYCSLDVDSLLSNGTGDATAFVGTDSVTEDDDLMTWADVERGMAEYTRECEMRIQQAQQNIQVARQMKEFVEGVVADFIG